MATVVVNVRLPVEHVQALRQLASDNDRGLADELRRAVRLHLLDGGGRPALILGGQTVDGQRDDRDGP